MLIFTSNDAVKSTILNPTVTALLDTLIASENAQFFVIFVVYSFDTTIVCINQEILH